MRHPGGKSEFPVPAASFSRGILRIPLSACVRTGDIEPDFVNECHWIECPAYIDFSLMRSIYEQTRRLAEELENE